VTLSRSTNLGSILLRYLAETTRNEESVKRVMIATIEHDAALLFPFHWQWDGGSMGDCWFESVADAVACAELDYGVLNQHWYAAGNPPEHCQQDWLTPARVPGRNVGNPEFGRLELYINDQWNEIDIDNPPRIEIDYSSLRRLTGIPPDAG